MQRIKPIEHVLGQNTFRARINRKHDNDNKYEWNKLPAVIKKKKTKQVFFHRKDTPFSN